jgi:xylose isomerase
MNTKTEATSYHFSFGPWNISTGADPFGPPARKEMEFARKLKAYKELGFDAVQFHDDDIVAADLDWPATLKGVAEIKRVLEGEGLFVEIIAPRLWEDPRTIDGAFTSNSPADRKYALDRSRRCVDIAREVGCKNYVLWLAREGSYIREAKCAKTAVGRIVDAWNAILDYDKEIRVLGEAKPNEPMDQAYLPTVGHMIGVAYKTVAPDRSGVLIESAHSILAGLDPADDMAYALYHNKLWSVHLNDQNGLKYDQDKVFGSVDLRRAFDQVWTLEKNGYGRNGECVGLDVKAMRTTTFAESTYHLSHSKTMFLRLLEIVRGIDTSRVEELRSNRQYEQLEMLILNALMGRRT